MASSPEINRFNEQLRASPLYAEWMGGEGIDPSKPIKLTDFQRRRFRDFLQAKGMPIPKGANIDQAGNANEPEGVKKELKKWGPLAAGAAVTAFGIPGTGISGLFGGGGAGAAAGAGARAAASGVGASQAGGGAGVAGGGFWGSLGKFITSPGGSTLIGVGGNLVGQHMAGRAGDRAVDAQLQANREALDFERQQYDEGVEWFKPYGEAGRASVARLSDMAGRAQTPATSESVFGSGRMPAQGGPARISPIDLSQRPEGVSGTWPGSRSGMGETVKVQAPDGEVRDLPIVQAAQAIRMGARRVA